MNKRPWWLLPPGRLHPLWWVAIGSVMLVAEYLAGGPALPALYVLPVVLAAWYSGKWAALALATAIPLFRLLFVMDPGSPAMTSFALSTVIRGVVIVVMALWFARLADFERSLADRVEALEGLLPICSFCKSIRNEAGEWERLERYISHRSSAEFSHGMCPSCAKIHYADWDDVLPHG